MKIYSFLLVLLFVFGCKSDKKEKEPEYVIPTGNTETSAEGSETSSTSEAGDVEQSIARGSEIYNNLCVVCHMSEGQGIPNLYPPLNKSNWLTEKRTAVIHAVKYGLQGPIEVNGVSYNSVMAPLGLSDQEVADVLNYVFTAWDNNVTPPVTVEEVAVVEE